MRTHRYLEVTQVWEGYLKLAALATQPEAHPFLGPRNAETGHAIFSLGFEAINGKNAIFERTHF